MSDIVERAKDHRAWAKRAGIRGDRYEDIVDELIAEVENLRDMVARLGYQEKTLTKENAELAGNVEKALKELGGVCRGKNKLFDEVQALKAQLAESEEKVKDFQEWEDIGR